MRLTQFSPGAGCGCKIAPSVLDTILKSGNSPRFPALLVGNDSRDDAAVFDMGDGTAVVSTTDFFMPVTDDAYDFGRVAAANAISDIYAMGATPVMAIAILGWPLAKLPPELAGTVVNGAREICNQAAIPLAGGHSIDSLEPIFGLAVTGRVNISNLKKNNTALSGDLLYLTKPLGVGVYTTAMKKDLLSAGDYDEVIGLMTTLNKAGEQFATLPYVHAMTDVTGFGLAGHLIEICEGSGLQATVFERHIPVLPSWKKYFSLDCIPGGTLRNRNSYGSKLSAPSRETETLMCDPQTSGGLLVAVSPRAKNDFESFIKAYNIPAGFFGTLEPGNTEALLSVV